MISYVHEYRLKSKHWTVPSKLHSEHLGEIYKN